MKWREGGWLLDSQKPEKSKMPRCGWRDGKEMHVIKISKISKIPLRTLPVLLSCCDRFPGVHGCWYFYS